MDPEPQPDPTAPVPAPVSFFPTRPDLPAPKEFDTPAPEAAAAPDAAPAATETEPWYSGVPFTLDDLTTAPPDYWANLHDGFESGAISSDDVYLQQRQRQYDSESPMLAMQREQNLAAAAAAPTAPDERTPTGPRPEDPLGQRGFGQFGTRPDAGMLRRDAEGNVEVTLETSQAAPPASEAGFPQGAPQPYKPNIIGWTGEDTDIVRAAIRGPFKAVDAMGSGAAALAEYLTGLDISGIRHAQVAETAVPGGEPTTTLGGLTQGITQYLTVAGPVGAVIKSALAGAEAAAALGETAVVQTFGRKVLDWALTYAGADPIADFLAFEANDPRASNLFNEYFPNAPDVAKALANYLAATGNEGEVEGRLKNVLEGRILDAGVAGAVFLTAKGLKVLKKAVTKVPMPDLPPEVAAALDRIDTPATSILRSEVGGVRVPGGEAAPVAPKKEKVLRGPRVPPKPPSLDRDLTYAEMGKGSNSWYHGVGDYVKRKLGVRDGNVVLDFMAIASQGQLAGVSDLNIAIDAFNRFRRGEDPAQLTQDLKIGNVTGPNIRKHLLAYMQGQKLDQILGEDALKVRDYRRALDGDPNVVVVDRWMWRTYYPDDWDAARAKHDAAEEARLASGEGSPKKKSFNGWQGTNYQYRMIQDRVTQEAKRLGMNPSDLQAQIWAGIKLATEGPNATGLAPMREMVKRRFDAGEIKKLPGQSVAAMIHSETVTRTAGILAALVAGHYAGDTDEEQATFALMAAGISPRGAKAMAKDLANLMPAAGALRNTQVAHEGRLKRVYHGTSRTFGEFDPAKADPQGLYGPGFYHTEDPKVAGGTGSRPLGERPDLGYAGAGADKYTTKYFATEAEAEAFAKTKEATDDVIVHSSRTGWMASYREPSAPQVRPAYLDIQRPFDIDKVFTEDEVAHIGEATGYGPGFAQYLGDNLTGEAIYKATEARLGDRASVNEALEVAGYDGITHIGGKITGTDPHRVWIAFKPEQIHSPFEVAAEARMAKAISGGGPEVVTPDDPRSMADQYAAAVVEARRGGPRTHELVQAEAQSLIDLGLASWDWIKSLRPGATLSDAPVTALVMQLADSGLKMRALTQQALAATDPAEALMHAKAVVQQLWMHAQLDPTRIGVLTETGRSLSALTNPTSGLNQFLQQFEFLMRDQNTPHPDPMQVVQAIAAFQDPGQLAVLAKQATKPGFWQMFNEYYINGLLWGPKSWMANFLGNAGSTLWAIPERALAARMGDERGVQAGEAIAMLESLTTGIGNAWKLAATAFKEGESQFEKVYGTGLLQHGEKVETGHRAISAQTFELVGAAGQAVDAIGNFLRFPMRVLASTDDFFKVINYNMELSAVASREARANLVTTHFQSPKDYSTAVEVEKARIMADPPLSVKKSAESFALYQTFTKELGEGGKLIQQWANTVPGGRILAPFIRTPINIFKYAGERTPLALATTSFWKTINGTDRAAADLAKARVALGSATMGVAAVMAYGGLITGKGPSDPKQREALEATGWKPNSWRVGNTYVSVNRLEPIGMLLTLSADYVDAVVNSDADTVPQAVGDAAWALSITTAKALASRTFVQGMAEVMAFLSNPDRVSDQFASRFLQSMLPASGLLRQSAAALDPTVREADGVLARLCSQTPGCSSTLPAKRTLLDAEPIWITGAYGPVGISRGKSDREMNAIVALGVNVPTVPDHVEQNIALEPHEKDYWVQQRATLTIGGKTLRERIAATMNSPQWEQWNNEMRATRLEYDIQLYHDRAKDRTLKEFPVLKDSIHDAEKQQREKARSGKGEPMPTSPLLRSLTR